MKKFGSVDCRLTIEHYHFVRRRESWWRATSHGAGWKSLQGCGESTRARAGGQFQMFGAVGEKGAENLVEPGRSRKTSAATRKSARTRRVAGRRDNGKWLGRTRGRDFHRGSTGNAEKQSLANSSWPVAGSGCL